VSFFSGNRRLFAAALTLLLLTGVGAAATIAYRNYRTTKSLLEADPPSPLLEAPERTAVAGLKSVYIISRDEIKLAAWYVPPVNGAMVIITHGTNGDRSTMLPELRLLAGAGYGVLAFDWPGLGASGGNIKWGGQARRALSAAIDWLSARTEVDAHRIGGLGFSMGGFVMTQVAARDPRLRAVVLEAPPPDFDDYIRLHCTHWGPLSEWPARWAIEDSGLLDSAAEPLKLIDKIAPRPVLLLVGSADREVSPGLVTKLYEAARYPKALWIVSGARHGGYAEVAAAEYTRRLTEFFAQSLQSRRGRDAQFAPWPGQYLSKISELRPFWRPRPAPAFEILCSARHAMCGHNAEPKKNDRCRCRPRR
jgi:pimeloyl-ACP methyl ester carboxylesterase